MMSAMNTTVGGTSSPAVTFMHNSPKRRSLRLSFKKQKSTEDFHSEARRNSFKEQNGSRIRKVQSFSHHGRISRRTKVLYKAKSKMMIKVTLSSPVKTPSPDIISGFDIDVNCNFKQICTPKYCEKSYKVFFDSTPEQGKHVVGDIIVKENEKEVERFPISEILDIQKAKTLHCKEMNLTAAPPEWKLPHLRVYDNKEGFLCQNEMEFLQKRKMYMQTALRRLLNKDELINPKDIPHIALMGSGGGYRAMIAMSGIINALYDTRLLDYIQYAAALSGSSWYMATLYSHPDWPNIHPRIIQEKMRADISKNPKNLSNLLYYGWDFLAKKWSGQEWSFTTDAFGPMLGNALISDRLSTTWSDQASKMAEGNVPLPLLSAIHAKDKENAKTFHEWVEFSPYEVNIPKYGAAINMKHFGSEFIKGVLTEKKMELPLYEIMGICGSAFTVTFEELQNKDSSNFKPTSQIKNRIKPLNNPKTHQECDKVDGRQTSNTHNEFDELDGRQTSNTHNEFDELDGRQTSNTHNEFDELDGRQTSNTHNEFDELDGRQTSNTHNEFDELDGRQTSNTHNEFDELDGRQTHTTHAEYDELDSKQTSNTHYNRHSGCDVLDAKLPGIESGCDVLEGGALASSNAPRIIVLKGIHNSNDSETGCDVLERGTLPSGKAPHVNVSEGNHNSNETDASCDVLEEGFSSNARMHVNNYKKVHDSVKSDKCRKDPEEDIVNDLEDKDPEEDIVNDLEDKDPEEDIVNDLEDKDPEEDIVNDLEDMFASICQIREEGGRKFENIKEEEHNVNNDNQSEDSIEASADGVFNDDSTSRNTKLTNGTRTRNTDDSTGGYDELDGFISSYVKPYAQKKLLKSRRQRAALVNNFMRKLSFDEFDGCPTAVQSALFENYLKNDLEKLCLIDAGLAFNSPYPLLFQPGRDIDLILSFDFTDRKKDENEPFKTILTAEQWARTHDIKFPKISDVIDQYKGKKVQELYIFEDEDDIECPIIMHFVLVNNDFKKYKKPGEVRSDGEKTFADFSIYDDQSTFHCTNFQYSKENFDRLSQLSEFIVLNNVKNIKRCIRKSIKNKRQICRTRQRHPTT